MKNFVLIVLACMVFEVSAQIRLSDLNTKGSITGTEKIPCSGSGGPALTPDLLKNWMFSQPEITGLAAKTYVDGYLFGKPVISLPDVTVNGFTLVWDNTDNRWEYRSFPATITASDGLTYTGGNIKLGGDITSTKNFQPDGLDIDIIYGINETTFDSFRDFKCENFTGDMSMVFGGLVELSGGTTAISGGGVSLSLAANTFNINATTTAMGAVSFAAGSGGSLSLSGLSPGIMYAGSGGALSSQSLGSNGQYLTVSGGALAWASLGTSYNTIENQGTGVTQRTTFNVKNGLYAVDATTKTDIGLGGTLTQNTLIDMSTYTMRFRTDSRAGTIRYFERGTGTDFSYIEDQGGGQMKIGNDDALVNRSLVINGTKTGLTVDNLTGTENDLEVSLNEGNGLSFKSGTSGLSFNKGASLAYLGDYSSTFTTDRHIGDIGWVNNHIGGKDVNAVVKAPSATEDGYALTWDNSNTEYTLSPVSGGGGGTVTSVGITPPAAGITVSGSPVTTSGNITLGLNGDLAGIEAMTTAGMVCRSASNTFITRALNAGTGINVLNGSGVGGSPTIFLSLLNLQDLNTSPGADRILFFDNSFGGGRFNWLELGQGLTFNGTTMEVDAAETYAELYEDAGATNITVTTAGTFYKWSSTTVGNTANMTASAATDDITATETGTYDVGFSVSFTGTGNAVVQLAVFVNGTRQPDINITRKISSGGDVGRAACGGILDLTASDVVDVRVTSDGNGDTVTVVSANLKLEKVGLVSGNAIANDAAANEITKSDGTDITGTGIYSTVDGSMVMGDGSTAGGRSVTVASSDTDAELTLAPKGDEGVYIQYDTDKIFRVDLLNPLEYAGTTLTLTEAYRNRIVVFTNASGCVVTVGTGLPVGWSCLLIEGPGGGAVTLSASGTTLHGKTATTEDIDRISLFEYKTEEYIGL